MGSSGLSWEPFSRPVVWARTLLLAGVMLLSAWVAGVPSPAVASPTYSALRGADRYETALLVSQRGFSPGVGAVVLVTGEDFPDALSAAPLAGAYHGPVLLTHPSTLDAATAAEIARLAPGKIFLVGLETAVADQVRAAFPALAADDVVSLLGADRYDTARLVAREVKAKLGGISEVVLAPGDSFADALSAAPIAAAKGWPILLTPADGPVPETSLEALADLGGTAGVEVGTTVDPGVAGYTWRRVVGVDRYDTSARVAALAVEEGMTFTHVALASGEDFPDALAAGPYLALDGGILLLTRANAIPGQVAAPLQAHADETQEVDLVGLSGTVASEAKLLLSKDGLPDGLSMETLSTGSEGAAVAWVEQRLTDLSYRPGPVDGVFDKRTYQAVIAFEKWEGLTRDGVVRADDWADLLAASVPRPSVATSGSWIEVNKARQVLLLVEDGQVVRTLPVSTGSPDVGIVTPSQMFKVYRTAPVWEGPRYKPCYLRGLLAIHGYPSVPAWPASHGCVRVTLWDMDELYPLISVGLRVYVF